MKNEAPYYDPMQSEIVDVDRMEAGVIVTFEDGIVVLYSASLLRQMIPQATVLPPNGEFEPET